MVFHLIMGYQTCGYIDCWNHSGEYPERIDDVAYRGVVAVELHFWLLVTYPIKVIFIRYFFQPLSLSLKDMAFTFIFLSVIGTTSAFPTDLMSPLFGLPPP